jgi:hypothetical protein
MKFDVLKMAFSAKLPAAMAIRPMPADEDCSSLTLTLCPEIIRLINDHDLSAYRSRALTDE